MIPGAAAIDARHRAPDAVERYVAEFASHPARLVFLREFLEPALAAHLSTFLLEEADFYTEYGTYTVDGPVSEETFRAAAEEDRFFRMAKLEATKPECRMSPHALSYLRFRSTFREPGFMGFLESLCGKPLRSTDDFGVHSMGTGDFLRRHSDENRDRQLALVLYLSPHWTTEHGGILEILAPDGSVTSIVPEYNSLVAFDVLAGTEHLVTPITEVAGSHPRVSIGGWYSRGDANPRGDGHS